MNRSDYKSPTCTVSGLSNLHPLRAEQLIGKIIASIVADEYKLSLFFTDGTMVYAEGHTMTESALDVHHCATDGENLPLTVEPFLLKYPALKNLSDCLKEACQVITEAAKALDITVSKDVYQTKGAALKMIRQLAETQANCNEVQESEAKALLKVQLILVWPVMTQIDRHLPNLTSSDKDLRDKMFRALKLLNKGMRDAFQQDEQE
jgi:hypothetical protein